MLHMETDHGRNSTYVNYNCRCTLCKQAHAAYISDYRQRKSRGLVRSNHGTYDRYMQGCRCMACTMGYEDATGFPPDGWE